MGKEKKKLSDTRVGKIIASMFGKDSLALTNEGKVQLTDEQRSKVRDRFGDEFLSKLESTIFAEDSSLDESFDLFDAATAGVAAQKDKVISELQSQIKDLRSVVNTLADEPEPQPAATVVDSAGHIRSGFRVDLNAAHNKLAKDFMAGRISSVDMANTIDITDLQAEYKMSIPQGAKVDLFLKRIYNGFNDSKYMTKRLTRGRDWLGNSSIIGEVSQQFTNKWTPKGITKFTPCRIPYRRHKINVEIDPTEVIDTWLIDLYEQGKSPDQQPLVMYIINKHILPKISEDITFSMIAKGKYKKASAPNTNDPGSAAVDSMDGFETLLVDGKTNGAKFNYFKGAQNVLTLTGKALLDYVDKFVGAISPLFAHNLPIYCSPEFLRAYKLADFQEYGKYTGIEADNKIRFSTFTLIPLESMYNSPILFATPKENFIELVDLATADKCINDIQKSDYVVKIFGEYSLSVGFAVAEAVFASVPAGYTPSTTVTKGDPDSAVWEHGAASDAFSLHREQAEKTDDPGIEGA